MPDSEIMTVKELAAYFKVHQSTIYRLLKENTLPAFKMGSDWRFNRSAIDQWRLSQSAHTATRLDH